MLFFSGLLLKLWSLPGGWPNSESCGVFWNEKREQFKQLLLFWGIHEPKEFCSAHRQTTSVVDFPILMELAGCKAKPFFFFLTPEKQKEMIGPKIITRQRRGREECSNCSEAARAFTDPGRVSSSLLPGLANASLLSKFKMRKDGNRL